MKIGQELNETFQIRKTLKRMLFLAKTAIYAMEKTVFNTFGRVPPNEHLCEIIHKLNQSV